jgi:predicted metal-binding protein
MRNLNDLKSKLKNIINNYQGVNIDYIPTESIVIEPWTRLKCQYGCPNYKKSLTCTPYPPKPEEMKKIVECYHNAILLEFSENYEIINKVVVEIEKECAKEGFYKAFGLGAGSCNFCEECNLQECVKPDLARPSLSAVGVDVHKTIANNGYDILGFDEKENKYFCYGLVLLE